MLHELNVTQPNPGDTNIGLQNVWLCLIMYNFFLYMLLIHQWIKLHKYRYVYMYTLNLKCSILHFSTQY